MYLVNFGTDVELGSAVDWLISQGVNIISSSIGWPAAGPGDGTGPINEIVSRAKAAGILWSQSAGNNARQHWSGSFTDSNSNNWNDFNTSELDEGQTIYVTSRQQIGAWLTWNDPWGASSNDYDLLLIDSNSQIVARSNSSQTGAGYPYEGFSYTANYTDTYSIGIFKNAGAAVKQLQLYSSRDLQYQTAAGSILVPGDSADAMTVGAVFWNTPTTLETFSSQGPTTDGRIKPDLVAPDGVSTATYGTSAFYGTSASSPCAAAVAALVKQLYPDYLVETVQHYLEINTIALGASGKDPLYGNGQLQVTPVQGRAEIAFTSYLDGDFDIYTVNTDGSNQTCLTNNTVEDRQPAWSPDGQRIAFVSGRDGPYNIYVMNSDGSNVQRLTTSSGDWFPDWSPDGTRIAFYSGRTTPAQVFVMDADGGHQTQLTTIGGNHPSWSPDGTLIAFSSGGDNPGIYTINSDGSNQVRLTSSSRDYSPAWSPDGSKIAFARNGQGIFTVDQDGKGLVQLTTGDSDDYPAWSPDGSRIAFGAFWRDASIEVYVMDANGANPCRVTLNPAEDYEPAWRPPRMSPSLTTNIANPITINSAQLNGNLASLGSSTSANVSFEWGLTTGYGNETTAQEMTTTGPFIANITGLTPDTTYHFRAKAIGTGTSYGSDMTFTTLSTPPSVTTGSANPGLQFSPVEWERNFSGYGNVGHYPVCLGYQPE